MEQHIIECPDCKCELTLERVVDICGRNVELVLVKAKRKSEETDNGT